MLPTSEGVVPDLAGEVRSLIERIDSSIWPPRLGDDLEGKSEMEQVAAEWAGWLRSCQADRSEASGHHVTVKWREQTVHALVVQSDRPAAVPLVLLHGWPSSFVSFHAVTDSLTHASTAPWFHVVAVSLPGFGGSMPLSRSDWSVEDSADAVTHLMIELGYHRFYVHGEDWGSVVAAELGRRSPDNVCAIHVSAGLAGFMNPSGDDRAEAFVARAGAYLSLQSTRPESIANLLADSPVGMLAWFIDKYRLWRPALDDPENALGWDFVFANATLYWITRSAASSLAIYSANRNYRPGPASAVPTVVSVFADADFATLTVAEQHNTVVGWHQHCAGGHLAALEAPDHWIHDVRSTVDHEMKETT